MLSYIYRALKKSIAIKNKINADTHIKAGPFRQHVCKTEMRRFLPACYRYMQLLCREYNEVHLCWGKYDREVIPVQKVIPVLFLLPVRT